MPVSIAYVSISISEVQRYRGAAVQRYRGTEAQRHRGTEVQRYRGTEVQRYRGTESVGDCVTAIYVELALFTLFEVLDEIDESATTSTEEIAPKENPVPRAWLVLAAHSSVWLSEIAASKEDQHEQSTHNHIPSTG